MDVVVLEYRDFAALSKASANIAFGKKQRLCGNGDFNDDTYRFALVLPAAYDPKWPKQFRFEAQGSE